jgi:hypothetical protein
MPLLSPARRPRMRGLSLVFEAASSLIERHRDRDRRDVARARIRCCLRRCLQRRSLLAQNNAALQCCLPCSVSSFLFFIKGICDPVSFPNLVKNHYVSKG